MILVRDNLKISLLGSNQRTRPRAEKLVSSQRNLRLNYEVNLDHPRLKGFVNSLVPSHHHELFDFMVRMIQKENSGRWSVETLVEWRDVL